MALRSESEFSSDIAKAAFRQLATMDVQEHPFYAPASVPTRMQLGAKDTAVMADVERLLAGRTRDVYLTGGISRLYRERSWPQTAKIIRSWMTWVATLDVLTLMLNAMVLPNTIVLAMLLPGGVIPPAALAVLFLWRKPRAPWLQGLSLILGMFLVLLSIALVGVSAGGEFHERYLNIMLFVAITAIIIFSIPLLWTMTIAVMALGLYFVFQLQNPEIGIWNAVDGSLFFASGIIATVVARRTMTILAQKAFLLELRDKRRVVELAEANDRLERLARTDPLTGVANRRGMEELLEGIWDDRNACPSGTAMLMLDIDHFKHLNDNLGHPEGDRCLIKVAGIIRECLRRERDQVARYGGEEFLVLLPATDVSGAFTVAERIRRSVETAAVPNLVSGVSGYVTVSIGIAVTAPDANVSSEQLQHQADAALYRAKRAGRNRTVLHQPGAAAN
jgi:diguanylate cyclase (GGDEF)-like protein